MKKPATKQEKEFMAWIKAQPCIACQIYDKTIKYGVDCHHITECGRRLGNLFCLPLCKVHHTGEKGFTGNKRVIKTFKQQMDLLAVVYLARGEEIPHRVSKIVPRRLT
jgi:hypothetical protein